MWQNQGPLALESKAQPAELYGPAMSVWQT